MPHAIRFTFAISGVLILLVAAPVLADGPPMKDGRFSGGPVTVLVLTNAQVKSLSNHYMLDLTEPQMRQLLKESGFAPARVEVWNSKDGELDCTCFAWNIALRFEDRRMEVPHRYLVSDEEAARLQAELDALN